MLRTLGPRRTHDRLRRWPIEGQAVTAGYSGTPLYKKLGYREAMRVWAVSMPATVRANIDSGVDGVVWVPRATTFDAAHLFASKLDVLERALSKARLGLPANGFVWASWPKKASAVATDITEARIREIAFAAKLVDVKVCAVDEVWSGLKLVIRVKDR